MHATAKHLRKHVEGPFLTLIYAWRASGPIARMLTLVCTNDHMQKCEHKHFFLNALQNNTSIMHATISYAWRASGPIAWPASVGLRHVRTAVIAHTKNIMHDAMQTKTPHDAYISMQAHTHAHMHMHSTHACTRAVKRTRRRRR